MTFRRSAPAVIIATVALVLTGMAIASNRLFTSFTAQIEADRFDLMHAVITKVLADAQDKALADAELVARLDLVRTAVPAGDRETLVRELKASFDVQKERFGIRQAGFATPPATMLLRLHAPDEGIGEDISAFRPIIVEANRSHQPQKGASVSRSGPSIVGVAPISDPTGAHVGSIEFGVDYGPLLDGVKAAYDLDAAVYFEEKPLREVATHMPGDVLGEDRRVGGFVRFYDTNADRMKALVTDRDLGSGDERRYLRTAYGVPYGVVVLPITNYAGKQIGRVAIAGDFSSSRASATRMMVWQGLMVLLGTVLSAGVVTTAIRGLVLRPLAHLQTRFSALAAGDRTQVVDAEGLGLCDEMAALAATYETLRTTPRGEP
jgi:methyl-accepting chemotaxis protein